MNFFDYLKPENPIAIVIVTILKIVFVVWIIYFIYQLVSLFLERIRLVRCSEVDDLAKDLRELVNPKVEKEDKKKKKDEKEAPKVKEEVELLAEGNEIFSGFCRKKNVSEKGIVTSHIKTVFEAGIRESRLDVGELIKHTVTELFKGNTFLKSLMASFIVLGLLGTLVGLADSLSGLSPVLGKGAVEKTSADLSSGLSALFSHLKTAFAPSIWGVMLTVIGVLIFSVYLRFGCHPVKKKIENLTLTNWVPKLYLTTTQRFLGRVKVSEEQIKESMESLQNIVKAGVLHDDVKNLKENLMSSNETLEKLGESAGEMKDFTGEFVEGARKLSNFQEELNKLYDKMVQESKTFQELVQSSIDDSREFAKAADQTFKDQNEQLQDSFKNLKSYEEAYVTERQKIDAKIQELLDAARNSYEKLSERNVDVLTALGEPMAEKLKDIRDTLNVELNEMTKKFDKFDVPIRKAADKIEVTVETFNTRTKVVTDQMRKEFAEQNSKISKDLDALFSKVDNYSDNLSETNKNQAKYSEILGTNVSLLAANIEKLDGSFKAFDEFTTAERGKLDKRIIELTKELHKEFARQNKDTNEKLESLFKKFEKYDSQLMETNKLQSEQAKTLGEDLSTFSESISSLKGSIDTLGKISGKRDDTVEKLRPLSDVANKMGILVKQLSSSSLMQEKQNQLLVNKMDNMAGAVKLLARGISKAGGIELPEDMLADIEVGENPGPRSRGNFIFADNPIIKFLKRKFRKKN